MSENPSAEDCLICFDSFDSDDKNWRVLYCDHKVCVHCYNRINITRTTMSGISHQSLKCPFCQITTGTIVGLCPDGKMTVKILKSDCAGFEGVGTIEIHYFINSRDYYLNRVAYLPNNAEGQEILELLKIAWDRRVAFTIGTSITTGVENTVVWNIHHKTNQSGGVAYFGYPDPTYFQRVKLELESNGVALR
ncbi:hypothetical protein HA402_007089 [Bradysia odoriphaga]|nr:hypothetical protein HA402_007089 [Bradysia odoriphaga]